MKRRLFNENWEFTLASALDAYSSDGITKCADPFGAAERFYEYSNWERVTLPHDWAVALPKDPNADTVLGARNKTAFHRYMTEKHSESDRVDAVGFYRKSFPLAKEDEGKRYFLEFEGVFRDATFYVNGVFMDRHLSGYTGFTMEITDMLFFGETNTVAVRVNAGEPEGWWYEGAGIYRNVYLLVGEETYFVPHETVVKADVNGTVSVSALLRNDSATAVTKVVHFTIEAPDETVAATADKTVTLAPYEDKTVTASLTVASPLPWHVDHPHLYTLHITADAEETAERFGFRTFRFDPEQGFFLNGEPLKLRGACVHQDFGGVGVALSDNLNRYKIARLKEMGVNAYRSSHHAPSPALLRACDELGMLVMDETRMFGTSPEATRQFTSLIKRDRNHACVFLWSIGNEEFTIQNTPFGQRLAEKACRIVRALDDTRTITYGGNNGLHYDGINAAVPVRGVNYLHGGKIDQYHEEHPDQPIVGTEESSYLCSRGGTVNDVGSGRIDATGNVTMDWGSTLKGWVKYVEMRPWYAGGFMWTGFDYRGEPSPFELTNPSGSFGTIDLCGMEKPPFYYYKAWWTDTPALKLAPHWNHRDGETVTISTYTNCDRITLSLNGKVIGTKTVERFDAPVWEIPFEAGTLTVEGVKDGQILRDSLTTAGRTREIAVTCILPAEAAEDIAVFELSAVDAHGIPALAACDLATLAIENGTVVGVGNGDPASFDYEVQPKEETALFLRTFAYEHGIYSVPPKQENARVQTAWRTATHKVGFLQPKEDLNPILEDDYRYVIRSNKAFDAPQEFHFETHFHASTDYEYVEFERLHGKATVMLDGAVLGSNALGNTANVRPFRFYAPIPVGEHTLSVTAELSDGTFGAMSGYCKIGKAKRVPWQVRLHYGKARVFVKPCDPSKAVTLSAAVTEE
ncbi:MAG: DUF4982 domain-containing protein [Clostridia bacterium]|nr:DUF4982 domain-containing protein [Clostridia bacterium]